MLKKFALALTALLLACCANVKTTGKTGAENAADLTLTAVDFAALPGWSNADANGALEAFRKSCAVMMKRNGATPVAPNAIGGTIADWQPACAASGPAADGTAFFQQYFQPYRATTALGETGLFTGYYESQLNGSLTRSAQYHVPVYKRPANLVMVELGDFKPEWKGQRIAGSVADGKLKPFPDRAAIDRGALNGQGLELVWLDDADDAFFLHIQGSGRVHLTDGRVLRIGYDGQNGQPYTAIGKELIARGDLTAQNVSLQTIRAWLKAHPDQAQNLRDKNASYVFFKTLDATGPDDGPTGAQNVALTPLHSLAVDPRFIPYGAPVFLNAPHPLDPATPLQQLLIAQDTGGAIHGPVRGDVFWGHGATAEQAAGVMKSRGEMFVLLPKTLPGARHVDLNGEK